MALPTGEISLSQVNEELGNGVLDTISLNDSAVRALAERPTAGSEISMSQLQGKSASIVLTAQPGMDMSGRHWFMDVSGNVNGITIANIEIWTDIGDPTLVNINFNSTAATTLSFILKVRDKSAGTWIGGGASMGVSGRSFLSGNKLDNFAFGQAIINASKAGKVLEFVLE